MARLRFAWRSLAKAPLLSLVVILSVGLGIGANTASGGTARRAGGRNLAGRFQGRT